MTTTQEFATKWNQIPWDKRNDIALAIQADCRNIIAKIETNPSELDHGIANNLSNAKYVLHLCRSDASEDLERGELHPDWNEVYFWTQHFFRFDFWSNEDVFTFPITKAVWIELTKQS